MKTYKQVVKQASMADAFSGITTSIASGLAGLSGTAAVYLLAMTGLTGIGVGYAAAKATAHGNKDIDTIKKEYENERLKADLGYLSAKTNSEYEAFKNKQQPKPARVMG